jgi:uroporphyrinogen-III synthase
VRIEVGEDVVGHRAACAKLRAMTGTAGPRWYVISLRPRGAHAPLRRAAHAAGHGFVALSPWRIAMRDDDATRAALLDALGAGLVVFSSPAAVAAARRLVTLPVHLRALAVGAGTAAALRRAGVARVAHPARMDSEGLLDLPELADVRGRAVGLVTAPGGRDAIAPALVARGARVRRADVYTREPMAPAPRALVQLRTLAAGGARLAIAASSADALRRVDATLGPVLSIDLRRARVLAGSARIARGARDLGYGDVVAAEGPRPRQLIAALNGNAD